MKNKSTVHKLLYFLSINGQVNEMADRAEIFIIIVNNNNKNLQHIK